jgi:hypothetical protein
MPNQTIQNVPTWAQGNVVDYASRAWALSQEDALVPFVLITAGRGATATAVIDPDLGTVIGININDIGEYYSEAPTVLLTNLDGTGFDATAECTINGSGSIETMTVLTPGSGYTVAPKVEFAPIGSGATATAVLSGDSVDHITVDEPGYGYNIEPTVIIYGGHGVGATAHSHLTSTTVTSIDVDTGGSGYHIAVTNFAVYGGTIIAPQNSTELAALAALAARGTSGNLTVTGAYNLADDIITEDKLSGLPSALLTTMNAAGVAAYISARALIGKKSSFLDSAMPLAQTLTSTTGATYLARLMNRLEHNNYRSERVSQDSAIGIGPELAKQAVTDAETLRKAGLYAREYLQSTYELTHKLFIEGQEIEIFKLEIFGNCLRALTGSMSTTSQDVHNTSGLMQAVGVASSVAGLYNALSQAGLFASTSTAVSEAAMAATATEAALAASETASMATALSYAGEAIAVAAL